MTRCYLASTHQSEILEELQQRISRVILGASVLLGQILILLAEAYRLSRNVSMFGLFLILFPLAAVLLMDRWYRGVLWVLVLGLPASILWGSFWFGSDVILCLLALPTALICILFGAKYGFLITFPTSLLLLAGGSLFATHGSLSRAVALALIWGTQAVVWMVLRFVSEAIEWSWFRYQKMRDLLENARDRQAELKQTQEDLVQANLELARVSERLRSMRQVAEEARRAKEEFVANVSHELRTPLNIIIGFSEMITQAPHVYGVELPPQLLADVAVIHSNSQHLASLVDDVLDLSQVDAGRMSLTKEWVAPETIIEGAVAAVKPLFESEGLYLKQEVPENLPLLFCDRTRIRQVVLNLLSNAGRFTERGGATVRVRREDRNIRFSVADTGRGIPTEDQDRLFQPFEQLGRTIQPGFAGSGLGLAISKRFVEMHGGSMWLESEVGTGTACHFSLPLEEPLPAISGGMLRWFSPYHHHETRTRPWRAPRPTLVPRYIVVESGDTLQRLLKRYQDNSEIVLVRGLDEAVQEASRLPAQALIINDLRFHQAPSQMSKLADLPYGTPIIACWLPGTKEAAKQLKLTHYLVKPVSREVLLSTLDDLPRPVRTVLLVDDEQDALQLFARTLASADRGYRVLRASTGQRALSLLRERHPDVMLLDLIMPGMDGHMVLREQSVDPNIRDIPVVAITAQDPARGPIASDLLTITRSGGLYLRDLLSVIGAVSEALAPPDELAEPARSETLAD